MTQILKPSKPESGAAFLPAVSGDSQMPDASPRAAAQEVYDRLLCRLVQLLKLHRNVAFGIAQGS